MRLWKTGKFGFYILSLIDEISNTYDFINTYYPKHKVKLFFTGFDSNYQGDITNIYGNLMQAK
jgi:hypothetical protein